MRKKTNGLDMPEITLRRFPKYLEVARALSETGWDYVTSSDISRACDVPEVLVRKDLSWTGVTGRPHSGYPIDGLIGAINDVLGWNRRRKMVLVSDRRLAETLLVSFPFDRYGVEASVVLDTDIRPEPSADAGPEPSAAIAGVPVVGEAEFLARQQQEPVRLALLAVPVRMVQQMADRLVAAGVMALWNFAPVSITAPEGVHVVDADIASGLAVLCRKLAAGGE